MKTLLLWRLLILIRLLSFTLQQEGGDGADRMEREAMQRSHSQLPYFLGKPAQEHTVIKSGYCVKQGAVVSSWCSSCERASALTVGYEIVE